MDLKTIFTLSLLFVIVHSNTKNPSAASNKPKSSVKRETVDIGQEVEDPVIITCERKDTTLRMVGRVLKFSDIPPKGERQCGTLGTRQQIKILELFATEEVVIDQDLEATDEELTVILVAPIWEVKGRREVVLNGSPGKSHTKPKARNGNPNGNRTGDNGLDGLPGRRAGNMYTISIAPTNSKDFYISLNGGHASSAQDGGDGADGINGRAYRMYEGMGPLRDGTYKYRRIDELNYNWYSFDEIIYEVEGHRGTPGGRGGDGGAEAEGGKAGEMKIVYLQYPPSNTTSYQSCLPKTALKKGRFCFSFKGQSGKRGRNGRGGRGGRGGTNGENVIFGHQFHPFDTFNMDTYKYEKSNGVNEDGADGKQGSSLPELQGQEENLIRFDIFNTVHDFLAQTKTFMPSKPDQKSEKFKVFHDLLKELATDLNSVLGSTNGQ